MTCASLCLKNILYNFALRHYKKRPELNASAMQNMVATGYAIVMKTYPDIIRYACYFINKDQLFIDCLNTAKFLVQS
jgi:hypothetical protein